jgi:putative NADH-flavin reductase
MGNSWLTVGFPADIKPGAAAARDYLNEIKKNETLDWTFFSPAIEMHRGLPASRKGLTNSLGKSCL